MDFFVLLVCLAFQLLFLILSLRFPLLGIFGVVFGLVLVADLGTNGLTDPIGYTGGAEVLHTYDVGTIFLIPLLMSVFQGLLVIRRLWS